MEEPGCDLEDLGSSLLPPPPSPMCTLGLLQVPPVPIPGCSPPGCPFSSHDGELGAGGGSCPSLRGIPGWHRGIGSSVGHKGLLRTSPQPWHARCPSPPSRACRVLPGSCSVSGFFFLTWEGGRGGVGGWGGGRGWTLTVGARGSADLAQFSM